MSERSSGFPRRVAVALGALALLLAVAIPSMANLTGSTFESTDGNLVVNTPGNLDWVNAPSRVTKVEANSGTSDDSFGQGAKENISCPTEVTGSIPPNKSDLSRFYVSHETVGGNIFLYLAWERTNVLGNANMDFEFNQSSTACANEPPASAVPTRTAGDMLVTYDFTNGGGNPSIGLRRWVGSSATGNWGPATNLSASGFADGAVNAVTVTDPINPGAPRTLAANEFGEAAINLTASGVFTAGQCANFASTYLKSRSAASFTSELKDFIPPATTNITNCGTVNIHKQDDLGAPLGGAVFTLFNDLTPKASDGQTSHGVEDTITTLTCTTDNTTGDCQIVDVPFGDYWAVETTGVPNHDMADDQSFTLSAATPSLTITLPAFVDPRQPGAILITKTAKNKALGSGQHPLAGATFDVTDSGNVSVGGGISDANGEVCVGGLTIGATYTVTETAAPTGYDIDTISQPVTISGTATCGSGNEDTVSFTDTPLSSITVSFDSKVDGATTATIECTGDGAPQNLPEGSPRTLDDLPPGTYDCQVVIDP